MNTEVAGRAYNWLTALTLTLTLTLTPVVPDCRLLPLDNEEVHITRCRV